MHHTGHQPRAISILNQEDATPMSTGRRERELLREGNRVSWGETDLEEDGRTDEEEPEEATSGSEECETGVLGGLRTC